jgi:multidrug resistance efflux pump
MGGVVLVTGCRADVDEVDEAVAAERRRHLAAEEESRGRIDELLRQVGRLEAELAQAQDALRQARCERGHALAALAWRLGG